MESRTESDPPTEATLAETVRELANQPTSDSRLGHARARALAFAERVTTQGPLAPVAELGWGVNRRLTGAGGSALPALIAYRVFVWLLPFALVTVAALGLVVDRSSVSIEHAVDRFGIAGYFAASVAQAAHTGTTSGRISALTIGSLFLLYETYALVRGVRAVHARAWGLPLAASKRPLSTALAGLAALFAFLLGRAFLDGVARRQDALLEIPLLLVGYAFVPALWLVITLRLPNRARHWKDLVPGAVVLGVAALAIHVLVAFILIPYLDQKQATYGALGLSAGIMLALYASGWAITAAAALNAELCDRRESAQAPVVNA